MCKCKLSFPLIVIKKKNNIKTVMKIAILMKKMDTEGLIPSVLIISRHYIIIKPHRNVCKKIIIIIKGQKSPWMADI